MNRNQIEAQLRDVCAHYPLKGEFERWDYIKSGNINQTFRVDTSSKEDGTERSYLLQAVNRSVFAEPDKITENIIGITKHLETKVSALDDRKRLVLRIYTTHDGKYLYNDEKDCCWRVMSFIYNAVSADQGTPEIMKKAGVAFGNFQAMLADYPLTTLHETIPDFHNTEKRLRALIQSAEKDPYGRFDEVREDYEFLLSKRAYASFFEQAYRAGKIPKRVTHNDTKCNNVMFDRETLEPLAVIDLDTVMPGFVAHDFGDAIRFGANRSAEDEEDLSRVGIDLELYRAFTEGFVSHTSHNLLPYELQTLPYGVIAMTLELAARFMKDYLDGDIYFITRREKHNLYRERCQTALLRSAFRNLPDMFEVINGVLKTETSQTLS